MCINTNCDGWAIINVLLAIIWREPTNLKLQRSISEKAALNPEKWVDGLSFTEHGRLQGKIITMALLNEPVYILEKRDDWLHVSFTDSLAKNDAPDNGWLPESQVSYDTRYLSEQPSRSAVIIVGGSAMLYRDYQLRQAQKKLSYQVSLPLLDEAESCFQVRLPGGEIGYLAREDAKRSEDITFSPGNVVVEARQFLGAKTVSGGASSYGFDCAGLVFRVYQSQGVSIPRQIHNQAQTGIVIAKEQVHAGDVLFFSAAAGEQSIDHVGIYCGGGTMIHASSRSAAILEEALSDAPCAHPFHTARRYGLAH